MTLKTVRFVNLLLAGLLRSPLHELGRLPYCLRVSPG